MMLMPADDPELVSCLRGHVDGAVLISSHAADPLPSMLTSARLPAVLAARPEQPTRIGHADVDEPQQPVQSLILRPELVIRRSA
jgi:DNA-binding LacI/PurR family transcriptional regulator